MRKINVGYGYTSNQFDPTDFVNRAAKVLVVDKSGRKWRGNVRRIDEQLVLVLSDGRSIPLDQPEISFIGDPIWP